ncbi:MAG: TetR/AcrR family transcriptional regulator [Pseudomonadota bacterium]
MTLIEKTASKEPQNMPAEEVLQQAMARMQAEIIRLNPDQTSDADSSWQERKSAQTRIAILAAGVKCLSKHGYAKTTTQLVAATAKISRGAMLHHYSTKLDLISSVIDYVFFRRMKLLLGEIAKLSDKERLDISGAVTVYWNWVQTPEFDAYLELSMASRKDQELLAVFEKRAIELDEGALDQIPIFFPEWAGLSRKKLRLANDMIVVTLHGLHVQRLINSDAKRRQEIRDLVSRVLLMLRENEL